MTAELVRLVPFELSADTIFDRAREAGCQRVIVIGQTEDGDLFFASNQQDGASILWDLRQAELALFDMAGRE